MERVISPNEEQIEKDEMIDAFKKASDCAGASGCKRAAEAMAKFYRISNRMTIESGEGLITFYAPPSTCPNVEQLLCQDKQEDSGEASTTHELPA